MNDLIICLLEILTQTLHDENSNFIASLENQNPSHCQRGNYLLVDIVEQIRGIRKITHCFPHDAVEALVMALASSPRSSFDTSYSAGGGFGNK